MFKTFLTLFFIVILSTVIFAQQPSEKPVWNVTLKTNQTAPSNITVQNRCKKKHSFEIRPENVSFIEFSQTKIDVKGGKDKLVPVRFNTSDLVPKIYEGQVLVICTSCKKEPTCTQDREVLPVILNVPDESLANSNSSDVNLNTETSLEKKNPCDEIEKRCEDLLVVANEKETVAGEAEDLAKTARENAERKEQAAQDAQKAAEKAENAADSDFEKSTGSITSDGETFYTSDEKWLQEKRRKLLSDYQAGKMTAGQYQERVRNLMGPEALKQAQKERKEYLEKLKKEAKEAKKKAEDARKAANTAKKEAEARQKEAEKARKVADEARKAYEDCKKKAEEECEKLKDLQAAAEAEAKKKADEAERIRLQEERRIQKEEADRKEIRERREYLITMIQRLGLIDSSVIAKVPSLWQWLPDILEAPVGFGAEAIGNSPIPTDTFKALGEIYGLFAKMKDPCAGLGISKISEKLERDYINPKTGRKYTRVEGVELAKEMCDLMREMRTKLKAISEAQKK